jgi:GntR family transcriptional regulator
MSTCTSIKRVVVGNDTSNRQKLTDGSLDTSSFVPLYVQIADLLRRRIENGLYKAGDKLPSENELAETFSISRTTSQSAIEELVNARLAYRTRGKGTFVAAPFISDFSFYSSFTEDMRHRGLEPGTRLLSLSKEEPPAEMAAKLKMPEGEYYRLVRLRLANNEPMVLQKAFLPADLFPQLEVQDFDHHYLYEIMRTVYGLQPTWGEAIIESVGALEEEALSLKVQPGMPVLLIWHLTSDEKHTRLEYVRSVYRADRFSFGTGRNPIRI